jgi:hypothetical protein
MEYLTEVGHIDKLINSYSRHIGGVEGERLLHYGKSAVMKLYQKDFNLDFDETLVLYEAMYDFGNPESYPLSLMVSQRLRALR